MERCRNKTYVFSHTPLTGISQVRLRNRKLYWNEKKKIWKQKLELTQTHHTATEGQARVCGVGRVVSHMGGVCLHENEAGFLT